MPTAVSRKFKVIAALLLIGAVVVGASFAASAEWRRGPFFCGTCQLRNPTPDPATRAKIDDNLAPIDRLLGPLGPTVVMVVCNANACVDYRQTLTGQWEGSNARPVQNGTGGGGGGGGGSEGGGARGGGGGGGGGGCVASCGQGPGSAGSGTVKVGDDEKVPTKQK